VNDAFENEDEKIKLNNLGVTIKKPKNKQIFSHKNIQNIYYSYDKNNKEIKDNIKLYNEKIKSWKHRNIIQKMSDYVNNKKIEINFANEIELEPLEMFTSQLNPIDNCVHDETVSIIKIQSLAKKKSIVPTNLKDILLYGGIVVFIVIAIIYLVMNHGLTGIRLF
jgi:uncharacterized phage-associated protein